MNDVMERLDQERERQRCELLIHQDEIAEATKRFKELKDELAQKDARIEGLKSARDHLMERGAQVMEERDTLAARVKSLSADLKEKDASGRAETTRVQQLEHVLGAVKAMAESVIPSAAQPTKKRARED